MARGAGNKLRRFTGAEKLLMLRLRSEGKTNAEIAHSMGELTSRIGDWFRQSPHAAPADRPQRALSALPALPALPVAIDSFIKPPTLAQLMGRR